MKNKGVTFNLRLIAFFILLAVHDTSFAQLKKQMRRAAHETEKGNLNKSHDIYLAALAKDKDNYKLNVSLGIVLSEFMYRPKEAIPYLENAYLHSPKDTLADLIYSLGKCYLQVDRYDEAMTFFNKLKNSKALIDDDILYHRDLKKYKEDCKNALNKNFQSIKHTSGYVVNLGPKINTDMPEYVPVITSKKDLIFTSKRKDTKNEKINEYDGKYYESMYKARMGEGSFESPRRYTIPDLLNKSNFSSHHESVISASPDGKILFVYRDNKIFEVDIDNLPLKSPDKLSKTINFTSYHNHAYLSKDGKSLFFTSEGESGLGGIDIYRAEKTIDNTWGAPQNLGAPINTEYDEEAPFLSEDGKTLYFASKGHPGYGNYDIYKSNLKDGKWAEPENLGQPVNSTADDIFLVMDSTQEIGYFSSSREGGYGDMDLYRVNFLKNFNKECITTNDNTIKFVVSKFSDTTGTVSAILPEYFKIQGYEWKINNKQIDSTTSTIAFNFDSAGTYPIEVKIISACDSCLQPMVACGSTSITINITKVQLPDLTNTHGELSKEQVESLGFDLSPIHFNFDKTTLRNDASAIIAKNLEILNSHPELNIALVGHTDSRGSDEYNNLLSHQRAEQTQKYLISQGLSPTRIIEIIGKGESALLNECRNRVVCDNTQHEKNRRVEFVVFKK